MKINIDSLVSISEANQNFSKVARLVDENGSAVILKNNAPKYVILDYQALDALNDIDDRITEISRQLMEKNKEAYEELAK